MYPSPAPEMSHKCNICGSIMILVEEIPTISGESNSCIDTFVCQNQLCGKVEPKILEDIFCEKRHYILPHHYV